MDIRLIGHSSFKLVGKNVTVVTDPYDPQYVKLANIQSEADIVTISHDHADHNAVSQIKGNPLIIRGPGEYESKGASIIGIATYHDANIGADRGKNTIYHMTIDDISVLHLGDLGHKLADSDLEQIPDADVLFVPVGGFFTIDASVAVDVVAQIDPKIVIPMHYNVPGLAPEFREKLEGVDAFLQAIGHMENAVHEKKLTLKANKFAEELQVVVMEI